MSNQQNSRMKKKEGRLEVALPKGRAPLISHLKAGKKEQHRCALYGQFSALPSHNVLHTYQPHSTFSGCGALLPVSSTQPRVWLSIQPVLTGVPGIDYDYLLNRYALSGRYLPHMATLPSTRPCPPFSCSWPFCRSVVWTRTEVSEHRLKCKKSGTTLIENT